MDYLSSASRSLTQVLDRAASCLGVESDNDGEGDDSESDEDFDAYYDNDGEDIDTQRYAIPFRRKSVFLLLNSH